MNGTRALEIKPSGCFIGSCEVEDAEIRGVYQGDLSADGNKVGQRGVAAAWPLPTMVRASTRPAPKARGHAAAEAVLTPPKNRVLRCLGP
jgi:hypothetical protein